MVYNNLSRIEVLQLYDFVMEKRKEGFGQRKISKMMKKQFGKQISENTICSWIFLNRKPFGSEATQFKPLPKPKKEELYELYINQNKSAQNLAEKYKTSTITAINWLKSYNLPVRTHLASMNTASIKQELREKGLRRPTRSFSALSPEKSYILGVLCGDGYISNKTIRFEIRKDEDFIKEFARCLKEVYGLNYKYYYYAKRDSLVLYAASEIICSDLLKYGKFGTFEWHIPKEIIQSKDENIITAFLKGLFDSEGYSSKYLVSMSSANKIGINETSLALKNLGIENRIAITGGKYYVLRITKKENIKKFREKIGFTIKRKMEILNKLK